MNKVIAIVGPTASGKTDLAKKLILKFKGEVVSVDSRQIYKGLDIGTAKDKSFKQYLIDIKNPPLRQGFGGQAGENFSVVEFQKLALKVIKDVQNKGKIPFLVGGTGYYLDSILYQVSFPRVKPNLKLRKKLEKKPPEDLYQKLFKLDPDSAQRCGKNKRRLIRALEIVLQTQKAVPKVTRLQPRFDFLILGLNLPREKLYQRIDQRVDKRIEQGMIGEVRDLIRSGVSKDWLRSLGLEYRYIVDYLDLKYQKEAMIAKLKFAIHDFARRQLTWLRRYPKIKWVKNLKEAAKEIGKFL